MEGKEYNRILFGEQEAAFQGSGKPAPWQGGPESFTAVPGAQGKLRDQPDLLRVTRVEKGQWLLEGHDPTVGDWRLLVKAVAPSDNRASRLLHDTAVAQGIIPPEKRLPRAMWVGEPRRQPKPARRKPKKPAKKALTWLEGAQLRLAHWLVMRVAVSLVGVGHAEKKTRVMMKRYLRLVPVRKARR